MKVVRKTLIDSDSENSSNTQTPEQILSSCLDTIGMGRYQWKLFMLCGLGWAADNMYLQAVSTIQIPAQLEFGLSNVQVAFLTSAMMGGMLVGATFWGASSDVIGRKPAFMMTLGITAIFNICAAFAPSYTMLTVALLLMGFGVGGNLPVDGALFLEFVPTDKQSLLALMSLFWPMGQFIASVVAWILIPTNTCTLPCQPNENMGWRYVEFTLGIITIVMVVCRVLLFDLLESPKYLLARGDFDGTARVLNKLAEMNNVVLEVTANDFRDAPGRAPTESQAAKLRSLFSPDIRATTIIVWLIWMFVALGNNMFFGFLPKFLKANGGGAPLSDAETYRNYLIVSASSVPGSILGQWGCDSFLGRKYTQALSTFGLCLRWVHLSYSLLAQSN